MFMKDAWYTAAWTHEIKDKLLARTICGEAVVLFRDKSGTAGARDDCNLTFE